MPMIAYRMAPFSTLVAVAFMFGSALAVGAQGLKQYDSSKPDFWTNPPPDWFLGDETEEQKGLSPGPPRATPATPAELETTLGLIKLPPGFKIEVYAPGVLQARQMAWGDKGTLFVGSFLAGTVYAVIDHGGQKEVKTIIKGLRMATGIAFHDHALYVTDIDKIMKYENPEASLDNLPEPTLINAGIPPFIPHGWKYLVFDKNGWIYMAQGVPCNICMPPPGTAAIHHLDPVTGMNEIVALGQRNSVGGDIDPRTGDYWFSENARDWLGDNAPDDKLEHIARMGEHFGYPYCHAGTIPDPKFNFGHKCSEFTSPVLLLGAHVAPLGMKFYTGNQFPSDYRNNILLTEHGSWNRHEYQGARIVRITVDPDGKNATQEVFASGWLQPGNKYAGRPNDILLAPDGSILVSDDEAGAIYRISYVK
jgi:glucose/arabinose dehydrogenase